MNEIILTSSVLILFIAGLRRILRGKISPTVQYALWLLVAARLLIPGTLFTAPVTIIGLAEEVQSVLASPVDKESFSEPNSSDPLYIPEQVITILPELTPKLDIPPVTVEPSPQTSTAPVPQTVSIDWLDVIWKTGIVTVGTAFFVSNLLFYRKLRSLRRRFPAGELPVACPIPVYFVKDLAAPCLFGSAIYVNQRALHNDRLRHVITHELTHRRHGDQLWALLRCVCLAIHWYNPLVWWAAILSRRDCELSCDSAVVRSLGDTDHISYGETLMAMLTASPTNLLHAATTMSASKRTMAERLKLIVRRPKMMKLTVAALALVTICAVILTFGGCADEVSAPDPNNTITGAPETPQPDEETQTGDGEKLTPPENGFGYIPSYVNYTHPSGLFTMKLPYDLSAASAETEDGISFITADPSGFGDGWVLSVHPQPADWTGTQNPFLTLASFDPNGTPQTYVLEYSSEYSEEYAALRELIAESFTLLATAEQFSRLIHDNYEENISLAISYLPYLSWRNYREVYGEDAMMSLQGALWQFADAGNADWNQYHDILSATDDGLDGAYSEGLSAVFEALFIRNQEQFLSVINSIFITDAERARVASYVKYGLGSEPSENDSTEITFNDLEIIQSLSRAYSPTVWSTGSPSDLTITLTGDWTLEGIKTALFAAVSDHVAGTLLDGDLSSIDIGYGFRFPEKMRDGVILTVPFHATYVDQDVYTLPSGAAHSPSSRTGELTATIQLVGEGVTGPVDEEFARGQAIYDLLAQIAGIDDLTVSIRESSFQLLDIVHENVEQKLSASGLSDCCMITGMSNGGYYNPLWCDPGYQQTVEYSVSFLYTEGEHRYQYTFHNTVIITSTE